MSPSLVFLWQAVGLKCRKVLKKNTFGSSSRCTLSSGAVKPVLYWKSFPLNSTGTEAQKKHAIFKIWQEGKSREEREMSNCKNTSEWKRKMYSAREQHVGLMHWNIDECSTKKKDPTHN